MGIYFTVDRLTVHVLASPKSSIRKQYQCHAAYAGGNAAGAAVDDTDAVMTTTPTTPSHPPPHTIFIVHIYPVQLPFESP